MISIRAKVIDRKEGHLFAFHNGDDTISSKWRPKDTHLRDSCTVHGNAILTDSKRLLLCDTSFWAPCQKLVTIRPDVFLKWRPLERWNDSVYDIHIMGHLLERLLNALFSNWNCVVLVVSHHDKINETIAEGTNEQVGEKVVGNMLLYLKTFVRMTFLVEALKRLWKCSGKSNNLGAYRGHAVRWWCTQKITCGLFIPSSS